VTTCGRLAGVSRLTCCPPDQPHQHISPPDQPKAHYLKTLNQNQAHISLPPVSTATSRFLISLSPSHAGRCPLPQAVLPGAYGGPRKPGYDPKTDPKCKAKSKDPAWKYCYWPDLNNKDVVKCILCSKIVHAEVRRLKQCLIEVHFKNKSWFSLQIG
jgi:hypothetical protein